MTIAKIVPRGLGIAFVDGLTIFVPLAAAGDVVAVRLTEIKGRTAFAEIVDIVIPSSDRVEPPCEFYGVCGGCNFQHLNYQAQLDAKVAMIRDCIERIGKVELTTEIKMIPSREPFGYRLRAQWHADPAMNAIGYFRAGSRELVDVSRCRVLADPLQAAMDGIRAGLTDADASQTMQIDASVGTDGTASIFMEGMTGNAEPITIDAAGEIFEFSAETFFQGNRYLLDTLIETALGDHRGGRAWDLYSGVGFFSLPLARRFERVVAVEEYAPAVKFAKRNAHHAGLANIEFEERSVRTYLREVSAAPGGIDLVLLDPPRSGTEKDTMENLIRLKPAHVAYVACEPSVLARDLKRFDAAGYRIDSVTAIDLFPQTHHVETVVQLTAPA